MLFEVLVEELVLWSFSFFFPSTIITGSHIGTHNRHFLFFFFNNYYGRPYWYSQSSFFVFFLHLRPNVSQALAISCLPIIHPLPHCVLYCTTMNKGLVQSPYFVRHCTSVHVENISWTYDAIRL